MRILHLGYEDPRQPGSGGGSVRTREINRRLARRHDVTVVVASYPGAQARVEDGVRWVPVGSHTGTKLDRLAYFARVGLATARIPHDLVVEDFSAPFSVGLSPLFTGRPVVASVQWLFARQMRAKYRLPFDLVESAGLPLYTEFIAVSDWLARALRKRRASATVTTIPNGIPPEAFGTPARAADSLLFLGRLDVEQKGCDLLLDVYSRVVRELGRGAPPLVIAGDGPDAALIRTWTRQRGLSEHVRFVGRVEGSAKFELIARAHALLMPSRFETFGMVAVEAQAVGTPLVCFDVGPLAEVAGPGGARLVPAFDVEAFAEATVRLVSDPAGADRQRAAGRAWARRYDWEAIAHSQEEVYMRRLARQGPAHA